MKNLFVVIIITLTLTNSFSQVDITSEEIYGHISFLASDSLKGRFPGTAEDKVAADYILNEFSDYGLTSMGENGFQHFDVEIDIKAGSGSYLYIGDYQGKLGIDYIPVAFSNEGEAEGDLVFAGFGFDIRTDSLSWSDYYNVDVKGKWVVILRDYPQLEKYPREFFTNYAYDRNKIIMAQDKGAAGVILVSGEKNYPDDELIELRSQRVPGNAKIPVINAKRAFIDTVLLNTKSSVERLEKYIKSSQKPASFQVGINVKAKVEFDYVKAETQNVIAYFEGNDTLLKHEYVIMGAHFDHLGFGGIESGSKMEDTIAIHNGADDNASGVAAMLELAEKFAANREQFKRSVIFMAFGAEEKGLVGSKYFVENPLLPLDSIYFMLNIDMLGRYEETNGLNIMGVGTATELGEIVKSKTENSSLEINISKSAFGGSDHASFYPEQIPVMVFNTGGHPEYHTPFDDQELINNEAEANITELIYDIATEIINSDQLTYIEVEGDSTTNYTKADLQVTLGIMPGFDDTSNKGLRVDGVTAGKPAFNAGILKGDYIISMDGESVTNIYDYMARLQNFNVGDKIKVQVLRGEEIIELNVQF